MPSIAMTFTPVTSCKAVVRISGHFPNLVELGAAKISLKLSCEGMPEHKLKNLQNDSIFIAAQLEMGMKSTAQSRRTERLSRFKLTDKQPCESAAKYSQLETGERDDTRKATKSIASGRNIVGCPTV
ncbi:hypothetical protein DTL21_22065 [Bremerella cremea]|uniref:Uncharacterized protein n=1 Tax=Blastopirellula marina TaxID=124 RepID=A0A2S8FL24_9BACT|nr:hypothetical protein C5Y83_22030 [Blastopirellula marina]RCS45932.1 hypothetical protein DTL21_22065 [Bremerella cremea]